MKFLILFLLMFCAINFKNVSTLTYTGVNYFCSEASCELKLLNNTAQLETFLSKNSEFTSDQEYYESYYGRRRTSTPLSSFTEIELKHVKIEKISPILFTKFSSMKKLIGANIGLQHVDSVDFVSAESLQILSLPYNDLKLIDNVEFIFLKSIEEIDYSHNKISFIHESAFEKINKNFRKIDLSFNQIAIFKEDFLWHLIGTKHLDVNLENNQIIEWITNDNEKSTEVMLNLNLNDNKLKSFKLTNIKMENFSIANNEIEEFVGDFITIDISNNKIKELKINSNCTSILASNNEISEIFYNSKETSKIEKLDLSQNALRPTQEFRDFLRKLSKVSSVDISSNALEVFALDIFDEMENLIELNLSKTGLSEIKFGSFSNLENIQSLNLSNNNLKEIDFHVFSSCKNLTTLDLGGNLLTEIFDYKKMRVVLPNIKNIGLEGNNWNCAYLSRLLLFLKSQSINLIEPRDRTKFESSVMKIKCSENSQYKIMEIKNSTIDDIGQKLNEVILKINELDEKVTKNETNLKSLIVSLQKDIIDLKSENIQNKIGTVNYTSNSSEVQKLMENFNKISMDRQKIVTDQIFHKINELSLKVDQNKVDNEKMILASQKGHSNIQMTTQQPAQNYPALLQKSDEKIERFATVEFVLGILLALVLTALTVFGVYQAKNYIQKSSHRLMRVSRSGRDTPSTVVTYDAQSV